jgi:amino acid transporter
MLPIPGALASIPRITHGTMSGFMSGWLCWIAYVTVAPIEVIAMLEYASNYLPWLSYLENGERALTMPGLAVAVVVLFVFTAINLMAVKWLARSTAVITFWKVALPILAAIVLIWAGFEVDNFHAHGGFAPQGVNGIFAAVSAGGVLFCLFGFRTVVDMSGEAINPQRSVPFAIVGAVLICLFIYMLLQVAFIGVIPASHLANGWTNIVEKVAGGPFASFAAILGLQWLTITLYADAVISPGGTGLAYMGTSARVNYAMANNEQVPKIFMKLNNAGVPAWSLIFNFFVGLIMFLPFPSWVQLVGFISSAVVLSFSFGPVSMAALRFQAADMDRPYRVPFGIVIPAIAFVFVGFAVYWTGWDTNWKVFMLVLGGYGLMAVMRLIQRDEQEPLSVGSNIWFAIFVVGLAAISWLGNFGNGLGILAPGLDIGSLILLSIACFWLGVRSRLTDGEARALIDEAV